MKLCDMVIPNKDFQTSVNIEFDFGSRSKVEGLIPTDSVCRYLEEVLRDVMTPSNRRAKLLVGAYGKGKSHVVLAALNAMWLKDTTPFERILNAYKSRGLEFGGSLEEFISEGSRLLPVVISGSTADLRHSLLYSLRNALKREGLEELMPQTNYDGAIDVLERWGQSYPETLRRFEEATGLSAATTIASLRNLDTQTYNAFVDAYPNLTSGGTFDALNGADVIGVYRHVIDGLKERGIDGVYVVYDEFSKYLETSIGKATVEDTKLLQDFAEACNRSSLEKQLHLLLISHKSLSNYIDSNLPKEKVDGWRGVSGRFAEIEMVDDANQYYELMGDAIIKDAEVWGTWLDANGGRNRKQLARVCSRYRQQGLFDAEAEELVRFSCYPLHPLTAYLLPRLSEKVAQNERTLFTFICAQGENTLSSALKRTESYVTPDYMYDYFEPLLRKEFYSSPLHRVYELCRSSLSRVDEGSLATRVIKCIASIDAVAQYDRVAPTRQTIIDLFSDCGFDTQVIEETLNELIEKESVVYLRRSNGHLKLKESSGVRVDIEVSDRAEMLKSTKSCAEALNEVMRSQAFYPSRYNEDKGMVRYFNCGFVEPDGLRSWEPGSDRSLLGDEAADGEIVAVYPESPDDWQELKWIAKDELSQAPMTVVAYPREFARIDDALFRLEAARQLKAEAEDDVILAEEYQIVVEDYAEIIDGFVAGYFQPELSKTFYYIGGKQYKRITRKRRLSDELSNLCDETFGRTPRITSEALNKHELTGTAFSSRTKILKALCAKVLVPNLGFVGNGQETSMARSALEKTGIIKDIAEHVEEPGDHAEGIDDVLEAIQGFIESADGSPFSNLYAKLTSMEGGIGLRQGPIPLYLAYVLRKYRDEIKIEFHGEERPFDEVTLDDISKEPSEYTLTRLSWSPQKAEYVRQLAGIFGCSSSSANRNDVAEAIRLWFVSLPQVTRNSRYDHAHGGKKKTSAERTAFFRAIKRVDSSADVFLFEQLPAAFELEVDDPSLLARIRAEKEACDDYLSDTLGTLSSTLIAMFESDPHPDASLGSTLRDWMDEHPAIQSHAFGGASGQVIGAIKVANGDDMVTASRIAKAAISLRVDDWNDDRFDDFLSIVMRTKEEAEGAKEDEGASADGEQISISFAGSDGVMQQKTFRSVKPSKRAALLKRNIVACLGEMGGALSPEEKRQVVFEVLRGLC